MNVNLFQTKKNNRKKITMLTCYDYTFAKIMAQTDIDGILVGDSAAMTMHGFQDTVYATLDMMIAHTQAVKRGAANKFIIADMPFLTYRKSMSKNVSAAQALMQAGANAIKLECAKGNTRLIQHLVESGVPVMGHIGLTPQSVHGLGGFKVQGKTAEAAANIIKDAHLLQDAGCFAVVLECVPQPLAQQITQELIIPTIGIGAGAHTSGQILVLQDVLGLNSDFEPRFVKKFADCGNVAKQAISDYIQAVSSQTYPSDEHAF